MASYITHLQEDNAIVEALVQIAKKASAIVGVSRISVSTEFGPIDWAGDAHIPEEVERISAMGLQVLTLGTLSFTGPKQGATLTVAWTRRKPGLLPQISVKNSGWHGQEEAFAVVQIAREHFQVSVDESRFNRLLHEDTQEAYAEFLSVSSRLARFNEQIAESISARRLELEGEYRAREKALSDEYAERTREADARAQAVITKLNDDIAEQRKSLAAAHEAKENKLVAREEELEALAARHSRRELRDEMKRVLTAREEKFELTSETQNKRRWIHGVSLFAIVALITLAALPHNLAPESIPESARGWYEVVRRSLFFTGAAALLTFYLRWQNAWFKQHADTEFHLRQFSLDVDRASWLVETVTELREKEGTVVPERLLESLSAGLFETRDRAQEESEETVDTLARTLLASDRVRLNIGGQEIELSGRMLRKSNKS